MTSEGPILERLTRRIADCPPEFLLPVRTPSRPDGIDVAAIVCDHLRAMSFDLSGDQVVRWQLSQNGRNENRLRVMAVIVWMLHDDWFLERQYLAHSMSDLLNAGFDDLADVQPVDSLVSDPDRREELARLCLKRLGLRPGGESEEQAADRLTALDSVGRQAVLREARAAEARARKIRERMAREAARAAAARYSPE